MNDEFDLEFPVQVHRRKLRDALEVADVLTFGYVFAQAAPDVFIFHIPFSEEHVDEIEIFIQLTR